MCIRDSTLPSGVAFHHGDVPLELRGVIEQAAQEGRLRCVVCTSSLTEGVNLPVHSVIIVQRRNHEGQRVLTPSQVLNALGRAGRGAIETEGLLNRNETTTSCRTRRLPRMSSARPPRWPIKP